MSRSYLGSKFAVACLLLATSAAAAPSEPASPPNQIRTTELDMVRVDLGGFYERGTRLVGYGTREPFHGVLGALRLDVSRFPLDWFGFEMDLLLGASPTTDPSTNVWLQGAALAAPLRWSGQSGGAVFVGVGGGLEAAEHPTADEDVRVYPYLLGRVRLWPTPSVSLHATWQFAPITSNALSTNFHKLELAFGVQWAQFGARAEVERTTGGDPERTYYRLRVGPFFGAAFY